MGTLFIGHIKKQASSFLHEKYQTARLALTDVTRAELLAEEATNSDPWGPDAKTMTLIAEASYGVDDYWRIVDVIHRRFEFDTINCEKWRQCYKSLALLEFLLIHGPEEFAGEFQCDSDVIEQLGTFQYTDENGFNWGTNMQKRSVRVLRLLIGGETLKEARLKALKITKEKIQGFGNFAASPTSSASTSSSSASTSSSSTSSPTFHASFWPKSPTFDSEMNSPKNTSPTKKDLFNNKSSYSQEVKTMINRSNSAPGGMKNKKLEGLLIRDNWDWPKSQENGSLLDNDKDIGEKEKYNSDGLISGIYSKFVGTSPIKKGYGDNYEVLIRSFSDVGRLIKRKCDRQFSAGY